MTTIKLALDWTPNVNHLGFLVAKELGFYTELGITLEILNPLKDNYALTPGKKLELDIADVAIAPFETVISLNNKANKVNAVAIYAILQKDLSCIATLQSANITTPSMLDGKIYASYKARYEDHIVKQMIKNDGGSGELNIIYPDKLGIWHTLLNGTAHATWIFDNWEGIEATHKHINLHKFTLDAFGIPYGYSPVVLVKNEKLVTQKPILTNFIKATQKGFLFSQQNVQQATAILQSYVTQYDLQNIDIEKSILFTQAHFGNENTCGKMKEERVTAFLHWLVQHGLEDEQIVLQKLFTNELFG